MRSPSLLIVVAALTLLGCRSEELAESAIPGGCSDDADNDLDGYFDCDDNDCFLAPDCDGTGPDDTDDGGGPGPGTDDTDDDGGGGDVDPNAVGSYLKSMSLRYEMTLDFSQSNFALTTCINFFGGDEESCGPCTAVYLGTGTLQDAEGNRNRYSGTFELESSDCLTAPETAENFANLQIQDAAIYRNPDNNEFFHTFRFRTDGEDPPSITQVQEWVAHEFAEDDTTTQQPFDKNQWWMKFNRGKIGKKAVLEENLTANYEENENLVVDLITLPINHQLTIWFSESTTAPAVPPAVGATP